MTEFDVQMAIGRLRDLYGERGEHDLADEVIIRRARKRSGHGLSLYEALDRLEQHLLSRNPNPERWD